MLVSSNLNKIINFQCFDRILQVNLHQLKHQSKTFFNNEFQIIGYRTTVFRGSQAKGCFCMKRCVWPLSIWHETWRQSLAKHDSNVTWKIGPIFIVHSRRNPFKKSFKKFTNLGLSPALLLCRTKNLSISILTTFGLKEFEYSKGWMPEFSLLRLVCMSKWPDRGRTD